MQLYKLFVTAVKVNELVVGARFDDASLLQHHDKVSMAHGGKAMGDDQGGAPGEESVEGLLDEGLALGVEGTGGFVEDEDVGFGEDGAGDADALALPTAEEGA